RAKVYDDAGGAVFRDCSDGVDDPVGTEIGRRIVMNLQTSARRVIDEQRRQAETIFGDAFEGFIQSGHDGRDRYPFKTLRLNAGLLKPATRLRAVVVIAALDV